MVNDRGSKKWSMSFILPEHRERLNQLWEEQYRIEKPVLDEQKVDELSYKISVAVTDNLNIKVTYWTDYRVKQVIGHIIKLDLLHKSLIITDSLDSEIRIPFDCLIDIS